MRSTSAAVGLLALTAFSFAVPTKRQSACIVQTVMDPSVKQVRASIKQWNMDVDTVNTFLDDASDLISANKPEALVSAAKFALQSAQDEPCQLMTLASNPDLTGIPAFKCAVQDLMDVFMPGVLEQLNIIIDNPGEVAVVKTAVDEINSVRCCNVLPDASILWLDNADDKGISNQVRVSAKRENACANFKCKSRCEALNNGDNGQANRK